jgi:hypothetical protein
MPTETTRPVDWSKPIQFANGEPVELLETLADGTRRVFLPNATVYTSVWDMAPDGSMSPDSIGERYGYWIGNREEISNE